MTHVFVFLERIFEAVRPKTSESRPPAGERARMSDKNDKRESHNYQLKNLLTINFFTILKLFMPFWPRDKEY